jgi:hypothetical protein
VAAKALVRSFRERPECFVVHLWSPYRLMSGHRNAGRPSMLVRFFVSW